MNPNVIVVGAGAAGLAAAKKLQENGLKVIVLEARNSIGGRVATDRNIANFPVELGAEFIHGNKAAIWDLGILNKKNTVLAGNWEEIAIKLDKKWIKNNNLKPYSEAHLSLYDRNEGSKDISVAEWAKSLNYPEEVKKVVAFRISNVYLASPEEIGVKELIHESKVEHAGEGNFRIIEGYDKIISHLSKGIDIRKNMAVKEIVSDSSGIKAICQNKMIFYADSVIVTAPLSVLQKNLIKFSPKLPKEKINAIKSLKMGSVAKIILRFKKAFWEDDVNIFISSKPYPIWWSPGHRRKGVSPVLTAFVTGKEARELDKLPDKKVIAIALSSLQRTFEQNVSDLLTNSKIIRWDKEPWIFGGYSFVPVGAFGSRKELAKPIKNQIFFAGEATAFDGSPSTVHGAIESGWRAAEEVLKVNN